MEHGLGLAHHLGFIGELQQSLHDLRRDALARRIGLQACRFKLQGGMARRVGQQLAQMRRWGIGQGLQGPPSGALFGANEVAHVGRL